VRYPLRFKSADEVKASVDASVKSMAKLGVATALGTDIVTLDDAQLEKDSGKSPFKEAGPEEQDESSGAATAAMALGASAVLSAIMF
jgi:hypothetical protein